MRQTQCSTLIVIFSIVEGNSTEDVINYMNVDFRERLFAWNTSHGFSGASDDKKLVPDMFNLKHCSSHSALI